ncbi:hypothetical protein SAMN04488047_11820 [Tranquillimonas alkanivorans]|uniref:Uncharacterized protein n=1 Tax=Tranquillimonas alkanivorans TaxID=441119 RepID=A0A1I5U7F5_9RHOB|nr:hypothetical protein SAMN04488047_11820 [Tranquillimonas alkanivorans]
MTSISRFIRCVVLRSLLRKKTKSLPRRLRIAEPDVGSDPRLELTPVPELETSVERDRAARGLWERCHDIHQPVHQMRGAAVVVAEEDGETGFAFYERGDVRVAVGALEDHQIAFPVAEHLARRDVFRTFMDGSIWRKDLAARSAGISRLALLATAGQIARQFSGSAIGAVDVGIDRLVADPDRKAFIAQATGDLFRRPAFFQLRDHRIAELFQAHQLAPSCPPGICIPLRIHPVVATEVSQFVVFEAIAADLAVDGRTVPPDFSGDPANRNLRVQHFLDGAPLAQVQLYVGHCPFSLLFQQDRGNVATQFRMCPSARRASRKLCYVSRRMSPCRGRARETDQCRRQRRASAAGPS